MAQADPNRVQIPAARRRGAPAGDPRRRARALTALLALVACGAAAIAVYHSTVRRPQGTQPTRELSEADQLGESVRLRFKELLAAGQRDEAIRHVQAHLAQFNGKWGCYFRVELAKHELARGRPTESLEHAEIAVELRSKTVVRSNRISSLVARANAYQQLGLLDKASQDIRQAVEEFQVLQSDRKADLERLEADKRAGKVNSKAKGSLYYSDELEFAIHLTTVDIDSSREDHLGAVAEVERLEKLPLYDPLKSSSLPTLLELIGRAGMSLSELSRLDDVYLVPARTKLIEACESSVLDYGRRAQFEISLTELDWRSGNTKAAIDRFERLDHFFLYGSEAELHPMYQSYRALRARMRFESAKESELEEERDLLASALRLAVDEFGRRKIRPGGYGFLQYADRLEVLFELMRHEIRLDPSEQGRARALDHLFAISEATTLGRRLGAEAASVERVRAELVRDDPEHGVLVYLPAAVETHVFLLTREHIFHEPTAMMDEIESVRVSALGALAKPLSVGATREVGDARASELAKLASILFPGRIREHLSACKRVTILSRDLLGEAPFEVLEVSPGKELGMTHAVTHGPSASVAIVLAQRARAEALSKATDLGAFALLALPTAAGLKTDRRELKPVVDVFGAEGHTSWFGDEFDLARTAAAMRGATATLLYTHGKRDWSRERSTVFVAQDGLGGADELERMDVSPVTILAICGGGLTVRRRGDGGAADLAGACFSGGLRSRCVVQCGVDLDALAAVEITTHLARGLKEGLDVAEAMRRARVAISKSEKYSDPFHRMMYVVGAGHAPIFRP